MALDRSRSDPNAPAREAPDSRPTVGLHAKSPPKPRWNYALPVAIALAAFALVIAARLFWGGQ